MKNWWSDRCHSTDTHNLPWQHHDGTDKNSARSTRLGLAKFLQEQENQIRELNAKKLDKQKTMSHYDNIEQITESDLLLAKLLQEEEYGIGVVGIEESDEEYEQQKKSPYDVNGEECTESDLLVARLLQEEEDEKEAYLSVTADSEEELEYMKCSSYGKAVIAVQKILELIEKITKYYPNFAKHIDSVSTDDMVFLAKNLLEAQAKFVEQGIHPDIDIGYHYTNSGNLNSIRTNGLMTKNERDSQGVRSDRYNGSSYGDGVYTGNDPTTFSNFGDTGLIVGRLVGSAEDYRQRTGAANAVIVPENGMVVLKTSAQCLPMLKYNKALASSEEGNVFIVEMSSSLQEILDEVFNTDDSAAVESSKKARSTTPGWSSASSSGAARRSKQTTRQRNGIEQGVLYYNAPERLDGLVDHTDAFGPPPTSCDFQDDCAICQDTLSNPWSCVTLKVCNHVFHKHCIQEACKFASKCPSCRKSIPGKVFGKSPSGSMTVNVNTGLKCGGFPHCSTIAVMYKMKSGTQKEYHENPGQGQPGKHATAYLPNSVDGQNLLKRLKFAFMHGLTFTVGTSMTTGASNQCTWSSIHHKTSPNGGVHGFPDAHYFANCNGELDSANVPAADELDVSGKRLN